MQRKKIWIGIAIVVSFVALLWVLITRSPFIFYSQLTTENQQLTNSNSAKKPWEVLLNSEIIASSFEECIALLTKDNTVACYEPADGTLRWSTTLNVLPTEFQPSIESTENELIIFLRAQDEANRVIAISKQDGLILWEQIRQGEYVQAVHDTSVFLEGVQQASAVYIVQLESSSGLENWRVQPAGVYRATYRMSEDGQYLVGYRSSPGVDAPVFVIDTLKKNIAWDKKYVSDQMPDSLSAARLTPNSLILVEDNFITAKLVAYDLETGAELWRKPYWHEGTDTGFSGASIVEIIGNKYLLTTSSGTDTIRLSLHDVSSGSSLWSKEFASAAVSGGYFETTITDGVDTILIATNTQLTGVDLVTGTQLWTLGIPVDRVFLNTDMSKHGTVQALKNGFGYFKKGVILENIEQLQEYTNNSDSDMHIVNTKTGKIQQQFTVKNEKIKSVEFIDDLVFLVSDRSFRQIVEP